MWPPTQPLTVTPSPCGRLTDPPDLQHNAAGEPTPGPSAGNPHMPTPANDIHALHANLGQLWTNALAAYKAAVERQIKRTL
jgi:hypothetical protein